MNFEFLVACHITSETDIGQTLTEVLSEALQNNQNDFDDAAVTDMIQVRHRRPRIEDVGGGINIYTLIGFSIELYEEADAPEQVIDDFAKALPDGTTILHVVKFEDPSLQAELQGYAEEIFTIEMKLRRVLSFIYLHAFPNVDFYDLLGDETINPMNSPVRQQMEAAIENEFFHLTFSQYIRLNDRKVPNNVRDVISLIRNSQDYAGLVENLRSDIIANSGDSELLADIQELLDPIEAMRNCVAHNRRPPRGVVSSYPASRDQLNEKLDEYLAGWEIQSNSPPEHT